MTGDEAKRSSNRQTILVTDYCVKELQTHYSNDKVLPWIKQKRTDQRKNRQITTIGSKKTANEIDRT